MCTSVLPVFLAKTGPLSRKNRRDAGLTDQIPQIQALLRRRESQPGPVLVSAARRLQKRNIIKINNYVDKY